MTSVSALQTGHGQPATSALVETPTQGQTVKHHLQIFVVPPQTHAKTVQRAPRKMVQTMFVSVHLDGQVIIATGLSTRVAMRRVECMVGATTQLLASTMLNSPVNARMVSRATGARTLLLKQTMSAGQLPARIVATVRKKREGTNVTACLGSWVRTARLIPTNVHAMMSRRR